MLGLIFIITLLNLFLQCLYKIRGEKGTVPRFGWYKMHSYAKLSIFCVQIRRKWNKIVFFNEQWCSDFEWRFRIISVCHVHWVCHCELCNCHHRCDCGGNNFVICLGPVRFFVTYVFKLCLSITAFCKYSKTSLDLLTVWVPGIVSYPSTIKGQLPESFELVNKTVLTPPREENQRGNIYCSYSELSMMKPWPALFLWRW